MVGTGAKKLTSFSDIFGDEEKEEQQLRVTNDPVELEINELKSYRNKRFKLYEGERLKDMIESIRQNGVLQPIIVRPLDGIYEILSGHNRTNAAKMAGLTKIPGIIKENITDEEAEIYYFETNLMQRSFSEFTHSEKAAVIAMRHSKMFSQGKRNDILNELEELSNAGISTDEATSGQIGQKLATRQKTAEEYNLSERNIARYLRIDKLVDELKPAIDEGVIPLNAGVDISYLTVDEQRDVYKTLDAGKYKVDLAKAALLREYSTKGKLDATIILSILSGSLNKKPKKTGLQDVKVKKTVLKKYFDDTVTPDEIEETIQEALEMYFASKN